MIHPPPQESKLCTSNQQQNGSCTIFLYPVMRAVFSIASNFRVQARTKNESGKASLVSKTLQLVHLPFSLIARRRTLWTYVALNNRTSASCEWSEQRKLTDPPNNSTSRLTESPVATQSQTHKIGIGCRECRSLGWVSEKSISGNEWREERNWKRNIVGSWAGAATTEKRKCWWRTTRGHRKW